MQHCTVCGAAAREGARFCTTCGARLEDSPVTTNPASSESEETAPESNLSGQTATTAPSSEEGVAAGDGDSGAENDDEGIDPSALLEPGERAAFIPSGGDETLVSESPSRSGDYASSWPSAEDASEPADAAKREGVTGGSPQRDTTEADQESDSAFAWTWGALDEEPDAEAEDDVAGQAPSRSEMDTDQQDDSITEQSPGWTWEPAAEQTTDEPVPSEEPSSFTSDDADQQEAPAFSPDDDTKQDQEGDRGASDWESWEPVATGAATVNGGDDEPLAAVRDLADELKQRIDRLASPASLNSRDVDPDDLADQLERWSRAVSDTDDLLSIVQEVRKSPRDLDAITRLANHATDLEFLVRHYQSITRSSEQWVHGLRRERSSWSDE